MKATRTCYIDDCVGKVIARDMCGGHYQRWRNHGDPGADRPLLRDTRGLTPEQRYELFADKSGGLDACWPWTGPTDTQFGYGLIALGGRGKRMGAHRWALSRKLGRELGPDEETLHDCDVPVCVNPAHLRVGTHVENVEDMHAKGRHVAWQSLKTHCKHGHELSGDNLMWDRDKRRCRECMRRRAREGLARKRARLAAAS